MTKLDIIHNRCYIILSSFTSLTLIIHTMVFCNVIFRCFIFLGNIVFLYHIPSSTITIITLVVITYLLLHHFVISNTLLCNFLLNATLPSITIVCCCCCCCCCCCGCCCCCQPLIISCCLLCCLDIGIIHCICIIILDSTLYIALSTYDIGNFIFCLYCPMDIGKP